MAERQEGKPPEEAIYQASLLRFRPIMMTTMAALLGAVPLAFGRGTGSELRHPLGITIIGGLLLSQLFTLYTTPVIYIWFDKAGATLLPASRSAMRLCPEKEPRPARTRSMNISAPFIRRPVATSLLALGVLMAGILAYTRLPVAPIPQVEYPVISVGAGLPGASPETMASSVATPLERQFGRIAGVNQMTSTSQLGLDQHHSAVRSIAQHRCRRARRAGLYQRRAGPVAGRTCLRGRTGARSTRRTRPS